MAKKWEYTIIEGENVNEEVLNRLGEDGWELVAVTEIDTEDTSEYGGMGTRYYTNTAYLKREKA